MITKNGTNGAPTFNAEQMHRFERVIANAMTRTQLLNRFMDPRRDIDDECGYPRTTSAIDPWQYQQLYDREAIAARVVEVLPKESWQVSPLIYEDEDSETVTPFEEAWDALGKGVRGEKSYYRQEEGSLVWDFLRRLDELSGIGSYGVGLLGLDDGLDMREPVKGVIEKNSVPAGKDMAPSANFGPYSLTTNATTKGRKLLFLRCFPETLAQVSQFESNFSSPRFGQPVMYGVTFNDPRDTQAAAIGLTTSTRDVHWTRVIHVADNLSSSEVFGTPRMRPVLNRLLDLRKIYSADGEGYWKNAFAQLFLETHPTLGGDVDVNMPALRDMMEQMQNGLQRWAQLSGMSAKTLPPQIVDPTPHILIHIEAICIKLGIPKRVFMGSERGELASSQDDAAWNDRLKQRQNGYITPRVIVPFVDRLITIGVLPEPKAKKTKPASGGSAARRVLPRPAYEPSANVFCPTGAGGGVDPHCSPGGGSFGSAADAHAAFHEVIKKADAGTVTRADVDGWYQRAVKMDKAAVAELVPMLKIAGRHPSKKKAVEQMAQMLRTQAEMAIKYGPNRPTGNEELLLNAFPPANGQPAGPPVPGPAPPPKIPYLPPEVEEEIAPGYCVDWPDLTSQTSTEKAASAASYTTALAGYITAGGDALIPPMDYLTRVWGWTEEEARAALTNAAAAAEEKQVVDEQAQADALDHQEELVGRGLAPDPTEPPEVPEEEEEPA